MPPAAADRDVVHAALTALVTGAGKLATTPSEIANFVDRRDYWRDVRDRYLDDGETYPTDRMVAVITSGPPGAGKSTLTTKLVGKYRVIDADRVKEIILTDLIDSGLLGVPLDGLLLPDGKPVGPLEVSGWVQHASTQTAELARLVTVDRGENFVMEGTLQWDGLIDRYANLARYEHLTVINVEVSAEIARDQARNRWWIGRNSAHPLGGRFFPENFYDVYYGSHRHVTICATRALELHAAANENGLPAEVHLLHTHVDAGVVGATIQADGTVTDLVLDASITHGMMCRGCGDIVDAPDAHPICVAA